MHILCRLFGHRLDRRQITPWRETWQTECSLCSTRLTRVRHGTWVPARVMPKITSEFRAGKANATD